MQHKQTLFRVHVHGSKAKLRFRLRGFVLELEQILKMTVCELGKAGLHAQIRI